MGTHYTQHSMWWLRDFILVYCMFVSYRQRRHVRTAVGKQDGVLPACCVTGAWVFYIPPWSAWYCLPVCAPASRRQIAGAWRQSERLREGTMQGSLSAKVKSLGACMVLIGEGEKGCS